MKKPIRLASHAFAAAIFGLLAACAAFAQTQNDPLASSFLKPPATARPQVWWHWVNGNISKPGITADLEAMKKVGIGGGTICTLGAFAPDGDAHFNSDIYWDDLKFAMTEAGRLGLELGVENCEGWSSTGGPWIKPEDAMKVLVWSEARARGGAPVAIHMPQPMTRHDFYRDVIVLAFPAVASEAGQSLADMTPKMTASGKPVDPAILVSDSPARYVTIPGGSSDTPGLLIDCGAPFTASALRFSYVGRYRGGAAILEASGDGVAWKKAGRCDTPGELIDWYAHVDFAPVTARYYRLSFTDFNNKLAGIRLSMLNLFGPGQSAGDAVKTSDVLDLSSKMQPDGTLSWTPPAGNWTIVRFGFTDIGAVNHPASKYGIGLECDKLSKTALEHHFRDFFDRVIQAGAGIPGAPLQWSLIDSYEVGDQNWTDDMPAQFKARTGYDLAPWMISFTGRTVQARDLTARFAFDYKRTVAELWDANYWGYFSVLLRQHGLKGQIEAYGDGNFDTLRSSGLSDMPMSEYWYPSSGDTRLARQVASGAHTYGHQLVGAESFTAGGKYFDATPWKMKREGDNIFAAGVNRYYFHSGAHQPWVDGRAPGMTWAYGIFQNRNNTWYDPGKAYFSYLGRCESLLQQGRFIGDILSYEGEEGNGGEAMHSVPTGYAYDEIDHALLQSSLTTQNGALLLPSGQRYRILALPNSQSISLPVLEKVAALVRAGAVVFGPRPAHALGLIGYPASETKVLALADSLWGPIDGQKVVKNRVGKGWVYWTGSYKNISPALDDLRVAPDFAYDVSNARLVYLHRRIGGADAYFISNQSVGVVNTNASFRVQGLRPEIWDPQKGTIENAPVWSAGAAGVTNLPLHLGPGQSLFIVFRRPATAAHLVAASLKTAADASSGDQKLVITSATYGDIANHGKTMDLTGKLTRAIKDNHLSVVMDNEFAGNDPAPMIVKTARIEYTFGGKPGTITVGENDSLDLPPYASHEVPYRIAAGQGGREEVVAWEPGTFTARDSAGKAITKQIAAVPEPIKIDGPWKVRFDTRWGGPDSVVFDSLVDWTQRPEPGIKFYSGTAEYEKTIDIPADWLRPGRMACLDLGDMESLANVTLNGRDLGCVWLPPYRLDVTGLLKRGANTLRIRVTNTWVNRLIGDSSLPADKRVTSTTQGFYSASDPLIPSGLFGPAKIIGADPIAL